MKHVDVAIVGAGPVGLTAALLLARGGAEVLVCEAAAAPSDLPRAISIADETFRIMDRFGLAEQLKEESNLDTGAKYFGLNDRLLASSKPKPSRTGHPAKSQFDQPVMEDLLWDQAVAHEHITMLTSARAVSIDSTSSGITIEYVGTEATETSGTITADWLIGADGGKSFTRDALGISLVGSTQQERWIVIDLVDVPGEWEPYAEFHGDGKRPYVFVPGIKGRLRLEYMLFDHEDPEQMTAMPQILALSKPFFAGVTEHNIRRATVYVAHQRVAEHYRSGRAFLIGDAAHLMPPFSGQGLNAGLRDASNIAWKILEVMRGVGTDALLDTYQTERRTHGVKMVKVSQRTGAVVMARGTWKPRLRDVAFRALSLIPAAYRYLSSMRFITPPDYSNGVAVPVARTVDPRLASMLGLSLSQPDVTVVSGESVPLDRILGEGWALIELPGAVAEGSTELRDPLWAALGATRVRITTSPVIIEGEVRDATGLLASADLSHTHYILVRPDKYVAAVFTPTSESAVVESLRPYVGAGSEGKTKK